MVSGEEGAEGKAFSYTLLLSSLVVCKIKALPLDRMQGVLILG